MKEITSFEEVEQTCCFFFIVFKQSFEERIDIGFTKSFPT